MNQLITLERKQYGKESVSYTHLVFLFNTVILIIFGFMFGWEHAGYSILFQFISTRTIDSFYHRYERVTLQVTTTHAQKVINAYVQQYRHGISCVDAMGGYSQKPMNLLHTVVSSYERCVYEKGRSESKLYEVD